MDFFFFLFKGFEEVEIKCFLNYIVCYGFSVCVYLLKLCNGVVDCLDGFDEGGYC